MRQPPKNAAGDEASRPGDERPADRVAGLESRQAQSLLRRYRDGLLDDVIPFWMRHGVDAGYGGFFSCLDRDGTIVDTDKGIWQQGRFAWVFGKLYNTVESRPRWLELCRHGIEFLDRHGFDSDDGRMWFHVARDGTPLRKRRYAFSEAFAAMAYGEYAQATGEARYARKAETLFRRFAGHDATPDYRPKWTGHRPTRGLGGPMIAINVCQQLRDSIGLAEADRWIDESIAAIRQFHLKPERECVMETVGPEGEIYDHFDGRLLNPGHAIEGGWFILYEAMLRDDEELVRVGSQMIDWMWRRGWDGRYGGLFSFRDLDDKPVQEYWHDMKFWWPHNEAIIATLLAYHLTGEPRFADMHRQVHDWAHDHFPDPEHGEWFGYLHRDGRLSVTLKGNLWKGCFHLPRMQLLCWQILERILASADGDAAPEAG